MYLKLNLCIAFIFLYQIVYSSGNSDERIFQQKVIKLVKQWSKSFGEKLKYLSDIMTRKEQAEQTFQRALHNKTYTLNGNTFVNEIADGIRVFMDKKNQAVTKIARFAEFLSFNRNDTTKARLFPNSTYYYFNADNITQTARNETREEEIAKDVIEGECHWWCEQRNMSYMYSNISKWRLELFDRRENDPISLCECSVLQNRDNPPETYQNLPMEYDARFGCKVNLNLSVSKVATNVYNREQAILEGVKWSEPLDLVFKDNFAEDPTLTWQFFASPAGFMRHFPAVQWSDEQYDRTYDFRLRTWYTEAFTSPKDVIILLDRSGSMVGEKIELSRQIVNNILDTLNDNDFVNIYTFTNSTEPVVSCMNDTLVQANEENLRLLRENLAVYDIKFVADIMLGIRKAFDILENFRNTRRSSQCLQAIMLITEGVDYYYDKNFFKERNWDKGTPIRIFTYQIGTDSTDARELEWIACSNRGYHVNITVMSEIREKILPYMNVMSRAINYINNEEKSHVWTYLHVDLADRRLSNWLWRKFEGIRQREVFLDYVKRNYKTLKKHLTSAKHMLLQETHNYAKYEGNFNYNYMTTVSLPVYGRRNQDVELIGVAGVDVPIKLFKSFIPYHLLGVNGYAFIVTNNGYILMHPDHRTEFENILKPTFNRVDLVEVELMDDNTEPRLFNESIVSLREKIVKQNRHTGVTLKVKYFLHEMKRVMLSRRQYFFTPIGPFTLGIVLPDKYGPVKLNTSGTYGSGRSLMNNHEWKVHPDWIYCEDCRGNTPEDKVKDAIRSQKKPNDLLKSLLAEAYITRWFLEDIPETKIFNEKYFVHKIFIATQSGLTRWRTFENVSEEDLDSFETRNNRAIDEDWYRRAVEENYKDESFYIYSVPFETSGFENNTMVTGTKAIFVNNGRRKTPVAVVGLQFNHKAMNKLFEEITTFCNSSECITCESEHLDCFILDNTAYVVFSHEEEEYTGSYIGDIRPDIMYHLIKDGIYQQTRMFDYQAICQKLPPEKDNAGNSLTISLFKIIKHFINIFFWFVTTVISLIGNVIAGPDYQSNKPETIAFENLEVKKTLPTPCDHEMWLFNLRNRFATSKFYNSTLKFVCQWPYVVERIPKTNLIFLAVNVHCSTYYNEQRFTNSPTPKEIMYEQSLPCYIATMNNYTRRNYMSCYEKHPIEKTLNQNRKYCGHTWK